MTLNVSTSEPSTNLCTLVTYIVRVYAPVWFEVKAKPCAANGSRHLWSLIQYTRYLPLDLRTMVDAVIQRNAYVAHPENVLLAMMTGKRQDIRKLAYKRVLAARQTETVTLRVFKVPSIRFEAAEYFEMIDWWSADRLEPPLTRQISTQLLEQYTTRECIPPVFSLPQLPCHTQAVERCVRLVTDACASVCEKERDGYFRSRIESRSVCRNTRRRPIIVYIDLRRNSCALCSV
jgi:hypothetical protein